MSKAFLILLSIFMISPVTAGEVKKCPLNKGSVAITDNSNDRTVANTESTASGAKKEGPH